MEVGHRFERTVRWTRDEITSYATLVGDSNPLHHDEEYARSTRFGGLIASGAQTVAFLMALCGSQTTKGAGVGLEFNFRLLGPARPDDDKPLALKRLQGAAGGLSADVVLACHFGLGRQERSRPEGPFLDLSAQISTDSLRDWLTGHVVSPS